MILKKLHEQNTNAVGIDFSEEMINIAKARYPNVKFIKDDFLNIKNHFQENSIDGAISVYSLYFVPKEQLNDFLQSMSYVMKKRAKFLIVTVVGEGEDFVRTPLMEMNKIKEDIYVNYHMKNQLVEILNSNNFSIDYFKQIATIDSNDINDDGRYVILATNNK